MTMLKLAAAALVVAVAVPAGAATTLTLPAAAAGFDNSSAAFAVTKSTIATQPPVKFSDPGVTAVPEPASWALMIAGFGLVGAALRRRAPAVAA